MMWALVGSALLGVVGWLGAFGVARNLVDAEARHEREIEAAAATIARLRVERNAAVDALETYQDALRVLACAFQHALDGDVESARAVWLEHYT